MKKPGLKRRVVVSLVEPCHVFCQSSTRLSLTMAVLFFIPLTAQAYAPITLQYDHHIFELDPDNYPTWRTTEEVWRLNGQVVRPPAWLRADGDTLPAVPKGLVKELRTKWDLAAMKATVGQVIASRFDREPGEVVISKDGDKVVFEGVGLLGRQVDTKATAALIQESILRGITLINLPVTETQPHITVADKDLREAGITEVLAIGESNFAGSPYARRHNIAVGLNRFNGYVIQPGEEFSFNQSLGPVNASTGYKKELVIKGDKTLPDYGGGLCQVSTTAFRGIWEYGFPITERFNHSYSVRYYFPEGTDATVYPGSKDVRFVNDSATAVLMQTHTKGDEAFFIYYGTRDDRQSDIIGPYVWDHRSPPGDKVEYTTDLAPGEERKVGSRVPGLKAAWYRVVQGPSTDGEVVEPFYSDYEARPLYTQIGITGESLSKVPPAAPKAPALSTPARKIDQSPVFTRQWTQRYSRRR